jgi:hypothetical protein
MRRGRIDSNQSVGVGVLVSGVERGHGHGGGYPAIVNAWDMGVARGPGPGSGTGGDDAGA